MSLADLLAQRVIVTPTPPATRTVPTTVRTVTVVSEEALRFGLTADSVVVQIPVVSIDNGEDAAATALAEWGE